MKKEVSVFPKKMVESHHTGGGGNLYKGKEIFPTSRFTSNREILVGMRRGIFVEERRSRRKRARLVGGLPGRPGRMLVAVKNCRRLI